MSVVTGIAIVPGYQLTPTEAWTTTKLNLMAKPQVTLTLNAPVIDEDYLRNGNFYSTLWATPAGLSCPAGSQTVNASSWFIQPTGAAVTCKESTNTPDSLSLFSLQVVGATSVTDVLIGQQVPFDLSATLRQSCTFSVWIFNGTSSVFTPTLQIATANTQGSFGAVTVQAELNLTSCSANAWTYCVITQDLSVYTNGTNGFQFSFHIPTGVLNSSSNSVNISRPKLQPGLIATPYTDDITAFISLPTINTANIANQAVTLPKLDTVTVVPFLAPTGAGMEWYASTAPTGWLMCDGSAVSRTTYAALFGVIGTTFGAGDGSTTFNLPNRQGKVGVGKSASTFTTLGGTGGEINHTLLVAEMPSHGHTATVNDPGHFHTLGGGSSVSTTTSVDNQVHNVSVYAPPAFSGNTASATTGITVSNATNGGGGAHNNLQPYLVVNYIIKT